MVFNVKTKVNKVDLTNKITSRISSISYKDFANPESLERLSFYFSDIIENDLSNNMHLDISKIDYKEQGFILDITKDQISLKASDDAGVYYGLSYLKDLIVNDNLYVSHIEDYPDLLVRGVLLDISRSKVYTLNTLKQLVDFFSKLRYNHLELYVEGFSFEYKSYEKYLTGNHITLEEYMELELYAKSKFIDLVPNQNGFGHMSDWLMLDEFKELAVCPDGFYIWGANRPPSTLNPLDENSFKFVSTLYKDMLPHSNSKYFNMNFDEPFELGYGKTSNMDVGDLFCSYFNKLYEVVKSYNKTPMLFGDCLLKHSDAISKLPKDAIFIDWGYNKNHDFLNHAKMLSDNNISFMCAPGTLSWGSITGKYVDMTSSIIHSANALKQYNGQGMLVTDWGDIGHLQYLFASIPGFILGAFASWTSCDESDMEQCLYSIYGKFAEVLLKLQKFTFLEGEYRDYGSRLFYQILWAEHASRLNDDKEKLEFYLSKMKYSLLDEEHLLTLSNYFNDIETILNSIDINNSTNQKGNLFDLTLTKEEISNSLFLLKTLLQMNELLSFVEKDKKYEHNSINELINSFNEFSKHHQTLWNARNKMVGYKFSNQRISWLIDILVCLDRKESL